MSHVPPMPPPDPDDDVYVEELSQDEIVAQSYYPSRPDKRQARLESVRADRLERAIRLMESIRALCLGLLIIMTVKAMMLVALFNQTSDGRTETRNLRDEVERVTDSADQVDASFSEFNAAHTRYLALHERTQRLICFQLRADGQPLPDNGDCEGR